MIQGSITIEDIEIIFLQGEKINTINYTIVDLMNGVMERFENVDQSKFFKALAIAVHNDGMPEYEKDYPDAESIMGNIRWIP